MKTVSIRLTDKQHYYLAKVAKGEKRTVEHLLWMLIPTGVEFTFGEQTYNLEKLDCDLTDTDRSHLENYPLSSCSWGNDYYGNHSWAEEISENLIADVEGTLVSADAAFDLQAEIDQTNSHKAQRKRDHEAKQAADKEAAQ